MPSCSSKSVSIENRYQIVSLRDGYGDAVNEIVTNKKPFEVKKEQESFFIQSDAGEKKIPIERMQFFSNFTINDVYFIGDVATAEDSIKSAIMQFGGFGKRGKLLIVPNLVGNSDISGNVTNHLGIGLVITSQVNSDELLVKLLTDRAKSNNEIVNIFAHGSGGKRLYMILENAAKNQYLNKDGKSVLRVKFYNVPVNDSNLQWAADKSGATLLDHKYNYGDANSSILGANGGILNAAYGILKSWQFLTKKNTQMDYWCEGDFCNFNQNF